MKLKVVNDYRKHAVLEADTIGSLKARIMDCFSLKAEDLSARVLVPDGRDLLQVQDFITRILPNCFDLLQLEDRSILDELDGLDDGDTLLIGWKGPFIVSLVPETSYLTLAPNPVLVDCYTTIGEFKQKIETATGEPVTEDNLPEILFNADDSKQLLCFGFYRFCKTSQVTNLVFSIYRNRDNQRKFDRLYSPMSYMFFDKNGGKPGVRYLDDVKETKYVKYTDMEGHERLIPAGGCLDWKDIQMMSAPRPLQARLPYMGPTTPSSMYFSNPPYDSAYHYDYGSPYGPYHQSGPPPHYGGGSVLPPGESIAMEKEHMIASTEHMRVSTEHMMVSNEQTLKRARAVAEVMKLTDLNDDDIFDASTMIADNEAKMEVFLGLPDSRKRGYIKWLLDQQR